MQQTIAKPKAKSELSPEDRDFLVRLSAVDFGPIAYKLINPRLEPGEGDGWTLERTTQAIEQYRKFLFLLHRYPTRGIVPSEDADEVWHTHILDTLKYREDCDLLFGKFLDHWPYLGIGDAAEKQRGKDAFEETQALMKAHFG